MAGELTIRNRVQLLRLPSAKRKQLLRRMALSVRKNSRQRLRQQVDVEGRKFTARKDRTNRKKLLRGLGKTMRVAGNDKAARVYFASALTSKIAFAHQHGIDEVMTKATVQKRQGAPDYDAPATRRQAKELRAEGYKVRRDGKGYKRPTLKWITENLSLGQAGLILRVLRDQASVSRWVIPLPARAFLGANDQEVNRIVNEVFQQTIHAKGK